MQLTRPQEDPASLTTRVFGALEHCQVTAELSMVILMRPDVKFPMKAESAPLITR